MIRYLMCVCVSIYTLSAVAEDFSSGSLLNKYGVSSEMLPKPPIEEKRKNTTEEPVSHFKIEPEQPRFTLKPSGKKIPEPTGNITIDGMQNRDYENCRKNKLRGKEKIGEYTVCGDDKD